MKEIESHASHGGQQKVFEHDSKATNCTMKFSVYLPPDVDKKECPVLYWLSGLTCTEQNFIQKGGAQYFAAQHGVIIINPDTSPRGDDVPNDDDYMLGQGASFYINAAQEPWKKHFQMYDYVTKELRELVEDVFPIASDKRAIAGHSMGGHGALICALKNPGLYKSISALSPIATPSDSWGRKAFTAYLGEDEEAWKQWDATYLVANAAERLPILVDQGDKDEFLGQHLKPELFKAACDAAGHPLTLNMQSGYDHGFYFVASMVGRHVAYHAKNLNG